jgi:hypothetical protein
MKRNVVMAAAICLLLSSCKKNYTCTCTYTITTYWENQVDEQYSYSTPVEVGRAKKKVAKSNCESHSSSQMIGDMEDGESQVWECKVSY